MTSRWEGRELREEDLKKAADAIPDMAKAMDRMLNRCTLQLELTVEEGMALLGLLNEMRQKQLVQRSGDESR